MIWGDFALLHRTGKESSNEREEAGERLGLENGGEKNLGVRGGGYRGERKYVSEGQGRKGDRGETLRA